ncbi:MAG: aconitase X catalytic domain-containing protein [Vulcanisaeta sp.]|nr:aconitase X catalytic domain-containing protein [Vulcanisaeta sp.]
MVYLSKYEERILRGDYGDAVARAMQVIVKVGEVLGADRLIEIETAHVAGVSYLTIGDPGLEYLEDLARSGVKFRVFTTVNPVGIDIVNAWNMDEEFVKKQWSVINALRSMGASLWLTCTPYEYLRLRPRTYHAWAESNAVAYVNAVHDAWTEKLPGPFVVLAALVGRVPRYGLYTIEGRVPTHVVRIRSDGAISNPLIAGLIGKRIAEVVSDGKPYLIIKVGSRAVIKQLLASYATYSPHAYAIIDGLTPNHRNYLDMADKPEKIELDASELIKDPIVKDGDFDAVFLGCPHYGLEEITAVINYVSSKGWRRARKPIYIATTTFVLRQLDPEIVTKLRSANVHLVLTTCPVVSPFLKSIGVSKVAVESVKQMYYLPKMVGIDYVSCHGIECLDAVFNE